MIRGEPANRLPDAAPFAAQTMRLAEMCRARGIRPTILEDHVPLAHSGCAVPGWLAQADQVTRARRHGDPLQTTLMRICEIIGRTAIDGRAQLGLATIAHQARCSIETARRSVRTLWHAGLVDVFQVLVRSNAGILRGPILYILRPGPVDEPAVAVAS